MINYKQLFEASNAQNWNFKQYLHQLRDRDFNNKVVNTILYSRAFLSKKI